MSTDSPSLSPLDGAGLVFAVVAAQYNSRLVDQLLEDVVATLDTAGVATNDIEVFRVPGSGEIPYTVGMLADIGEFDCIIALGVIIEGDTPHADVLGQTTAEQLQHIPFETRIPVINGILLARTVAQAEARTIGSQRRGAELARAALAMADLKIKLNDRLAEIEERRRQDEEARAAAEGWGDPYRRDLDEDEEDDAAGEDWKKQ